MSHYITDGSINIPTTIQSIRIVASGEGGTGATVSGSNCTNGTTGRTTSFLGVSAGGGQSGKCGSSITPPPVYNQQTCTRRVSRTCTRRVSRTCTRRVSQTCTRRVSQTCTRRVSRTCTRRVSQTCTYTAYDSCPEYTTCYTPVQTITPDPYYVQQTCYAYDGGCPYFYYLCATGNPSGCFYAALYCPYPYECGYYYQPPSYTTGGDPYQCATGNTYNCNPHEVQYDCSYDENYDCSYDEQYDCSYDENYDCSYDEDYDCSYDEDYDCSYDENYDCSYYTQPPNVTTGGDGGSGGTATGGNIVNSNGNSGGAGTSSPLSGGAGGTGHLGGDGTAGNTSSSGSNYYFGGGGGEGAYVETIYTSAELSANNWFGTQSFSVNGGSGLNNGYLDIYFEFPQMRIKTSNGWQTVRNIYIKTGESTWSNVISAHIKQ